MRNHYLPQFLLRGFPDRDGLWQLDIHTGNFERRSVRNAGQRRNFYSAELEKGLLQRIDGSAAAVLASGVLGPKGEILIGEGDRAVLARWLALFGMRGPQAFESFSRRVQEVAKKPEIAIETLYENRDEAIQVVRRSSPETFADLVEEIGQVQAEGLCLALFSNLISEGKLKVTPDPKGVFEQYVDDEDRMERLAAHLLDLEWVWLQSRYGFVIGDNPLCRWSRRTGNWDYAVTRRDVEITIPLSSSLCLRMSRRRQKKRRALLCGRKLSETYNRRQVLSSVYNVYGSHRRLRPVAARAVRKALESGVLASAPRHAP